MKCSICRRPLLHCAVPGIAIGPTCAKRRGLAPEPKPRRPRLFGMRHTTPDAAQLDWIALLTQVTHTGAVAAFQESP